MKDLSELQPLLHNPQKRQLYVTLLQGTELNSRGLKTSFFPPHNLMKSMGFLTFIGLLQEEITKIIVDFDVPEAMAILKLLSSVPTDKSNQSEANMQYLKAVKISGQSIIAIASRKGLAYLQTFVDLVTNPSVQRLLINYPRASETVVRFVLNDKLDIPRLIVLKGLLTQNKVVDYIVSQRCLENVLTVAMPSHQNSSSTENRGQVDVPREIVPVSSNPFSIWASSNQSSTAENSNMDSDYNLDLEQTSVKTDDSNQVKAVLTDKEFLDIGVLNWPKEHLASLQKAFSEEESSSENMSMP
ncbi:hypothetical protein ACQUW5_06930 [Legionella sp. CNM-1927-20]|uniref:hypothetical protein n=1 Tax=Legionella sp. CNM-1927-20 TaxID=3422221 RepID=UPI00403B25EA